MKKLLLSYCLFLISILSLPKDLFSQNVGIGTDAPHSSARLDIKSVNSGLLPPRMSAAQRDAIPSPAKGLMVFINNDSSFYLYDGSWKKLVSSSETWNLDGNTINSNKYIGTKNNLPVKFRVNNADKMILDSTGRLQIFGTNESLMIGQEAGLNDEGHNYSFFIGHRAGASNTSGFANYFSGNHTGENNTTGTYNHFSGLSAGRSNTTGNKNYFIGIGSGSLNTTGDFNFFEGVSAGFNNITGDSNYYSGHYAGGSGLGSNNMVIGIKAGEYLVHGSQNMLIGNLSNVTVDGLTNASAIGYNAKVSQSNSMILGGTGTHKVKVGIGTTAPQNALDVNSGEAFSDIATFRSTGGWGQILVTNGETTNDFGTWGNTGYVGTNSPGHFQIRTGAFPRITIQDVTGNVGIATTTPDPSAKLDITSTTGGLLPPRMSAANRDAIPSPAKGLMVFINDDSSFYFFDGAWKRLIPANETWNLGGNNTTILQFIGTTNNQPLRFRVQNIQRMIMDSNGRLQLFGANNSLVIGQSAGYAGFSNFVVGNSAGSFVNTGQANYFSGNNAGRHATTASDNYFSGNFAGYENTTGNANFFSGLYSGQHNTTGSENHFNGTMAGHFHVNGDDNHFDGFYAGSNNTNGTYNYYSGPRAGMNSKGSYNYGSGVSAGMNNNHGWNNTLIGNYADVTVDSLNNAAAIGFQAKVSQHNSMVLGGTGTYRVNVGIGTTIPQTTLDVNSGSTFSDVATFRSTGGFAQIILTEGTTRIDIGSYPGGGYTGTNSPGDFHIRTGTATRMFFKDGTGNVGINTFTPSEKLDVNGNINLSGKIINETFQTPLLLAGWTHYNNGYAPGTFYKDKEGRVHLSGTVFYSSGSPVNTNIFNLPAGYRPLIGKFQFVVANTNGLGRIEVSTSGNVTIAGGVAGWFCLDGISFRAE